jgi:hypothetical protein
MSTGGGRPARWQEEKTDMPAPMTCTAAADFVFDVQVQITCTVCSQVIEEAVRDVADA